MKQFQASEAGANPGRVRVKICGITSVDDAQAAVAAGVDALGLVFTQYSKRCITPEVAAEIATRVPPFVTRVALFLDDDWSFVDHVLSTVSLDLLQFHGRESAAFCRQFERPYIKAIAMGEPATDIAEQAGHHPDAGALLLDANRLGEPGGQGRAFDWTMPIDMLTQPIIAAGGLTPDNIASAIERLSPYAVDVSSGVESGPGIKDHRLMKHFIQAVNQAGPS